MINMTNGTYITMRLVPLKFTFCPFFSPYKIVLGFLGYNFAFIAIGPAPKSAYRHEFQCFEIGNPPPFVKLVFAHQPAGLLKKRHNLSFKGDVKWNFVIFQISETRKISRSVGATVPHFVKHGFYIHIVG